MSACPRSARAATMKFSVISPELGSRRAQPGRSAMTFFTEVLMGVRLIIVRGCSRL